MDRSDLVCASSGVVAPYVASAPIAALPRDKEAQVLCVPVLLRPGGFLLALPTGSVPPALLAAGAEPEAVGMHGPSTTLEVAAVEEDEDGSERPVSDSLSVLLVDLSDEALKFLVPYDSEAGLSVVSFDPVEGEVSAALTQQSNALTMLVTHLISQASEASADFGGGASGSGLSSKGSARREKLQAELANYTGAFMLSVAQAGARRMNPTAPPPRSLAELRSSPAPFRFTEYVERYGGYQHQRELGLIQYMLCQDHGKWEVAYVLSLFPDPPGQVFQSRSSAQNPRLVKACGAIGEVDVPSASRRSAQLLARLGDLSEELTYTGLASDGYGPAFPGASLSEEQRGAALAPYRNLDADRLKLSGKANWDPSPYLHDALYLAFREPDSLLRPVIPKPSRAEVPASPEHDTGQLCKVAGLWDANDLLFLSPEGPPAERPYEAVRLFNCLKNSTTDRQIADRRGRNHVECIVPGPSREIPTGPSLQCLYADPARQSFRIWATDRKDWYHQLLVPPRRYLASGAAVPRPGSRLHLGFRGILQGDALGVEFACEDSIIDGLVIDDYYAISVHSDGDASPSQAELAFRAAKAAYARAGIMGSDDKDVRGEDLAVCTGAEIDSCPAALHHRPPPPEPVGGLDVHLVDATKVRPQAARTVPLPRAVANELSLLSALCHVLVADVSSDWLPEIFATDSSEDKGAIVKADLDRDASKVLWGASLGPSSSAQLLSKERAALMRVDRFCEELLEEHPKAAPKRPLALRLHFLEVCATPAGLTQLVGELGWKVGPVLSPWHSPEYDLAGGRLLEWCPVSESIVDWAEAPFRGKVIAARLEAVEALLLATEGLESPLVNQYALGLPWQVSWLSVFVLCATRMRGLRRIAAVATAFGLSVQVRAMASFRGTLLILLGRPREGEPFCPKATGVDSKLFTQTDGVVDIDAINAVLSKYGRELYANGRPFSHFSETINAFAARTPKCRRLLQPAWDTAFGWRRAEPIQHHAAMPWQVLCSCVALAFLWGWPLVAGALALCWGGLLRPGELIAAHRYTAARHQSVKIDHPDILNVISIAYAPLLAGSKLWPSSGQTLRTRLRQLLDALKIPAVPTQGARHLELAWYKDEGDGSVRARYRIRRALDEYHNLVQAARFLQNAGIVGGYAAEAVQFGFANKLVMRIEYCALKLPASPARTMRQRLYSLASPTNLCWAVAEREDDEGSGPAEDVPIFLEPSVEDEVAVPKALLGKVIGKQAATIIEIREKSGAFKVDARDQTSDPCMVKVAGTAEAVKKAKDLILELIDQTKQKHLSSHYVEIPRSKIGMVIGLKGAQVNEVQAQTQTKIDVDFETDPCKCYIKGEADNVDRAKKVLLTIAMQLEDEASEYLDLPKTVSGALIGAQGSRIRQFQETSGARIDIDKSGNRCKVRLTGSKEAVSIAKSLIQACPLQVRATRILSHEEWTLCECGVAIAQPYQARRYRRRPGRQVRQRVVTGAEEVSGAAVVGEPLAAALSLLFSCDFWWFALTLSAMSCFCKVSLPPQLALSLPAVPAALAFPEEKDAAMMALRVIIVAVLSVPTLGTVLARAKLRQGSKSWQDFSPCSCSECLGEHKNDGGDGSVGFQCFPKTSGLADCRQTEPVATRVVQSADVLSYDRFCLYTCKPLLTDEIKPVVDCAHLNDKEITELAQSPSSNGREIVYEAHPLARVGPISQVLAQPEASMLDTASVVDRSSDPVSAIRATFASLRKAETAAPGVSPYTLPDAAKAPPLCVCHCGNKVNRMRQTESDGIMYPKPKQVRLPLAVTSAGNPAAQPEPPQPPMPPS
ncbi:FUBP3, partial [Symbiodinium necroappetens]